MSIEIGRKLCLILIPLAMAFIYFTVKKYNSRSRNDKVTLISRIIIILLLLISFGDVTVSIRGKNVSTLFLLDVSQSMGDFGKEGLKFINNSLEEMPSNNKAGVIVFGDNSKIDKVINSSKNYDSIKGEPIKTATNIQEAIETGIGLFSKGSSKRIVLITDGEENQGELVKSIPLIQEQNIDIKVYKVNNALGNEIYVDDVKVPDNISIGEEFSVITTIESNYKTKAKLSLFSGREKKGEQEVEIQKGKNTFVFKDIQNSGGFKNYRVTVEAADDSNLANNQYSTYTNVIDKPNILVIEGKANDGAGVSEILRATNSRYKVILPTSSPNTLNEMLEYKTIVLANVHIDDLSKGFKDNIEGYVKDYGGGLVTFGGEDSYALGGYRETVLEKILPVDMDKKGENEVPKVSLTLIIDKSGSMSGGTKEVSKLTLAKEAASKSVDSLRKTDEISVMTFDDSFGWVVERQLVGDRSGAKELISGIGLGGGTSIYPALEAGYKDALESDAKIKHIILLTDGQDGFPQHEYEALINEMKEDNITLSTVSVGMDSNNSLLEYMAEIGNGRGYHTDAFTDIPRIFMKEVFLSMGEYIENGEFTPTLTSNHEIMTGVLSDGGMPSLYGYIGTSMKDKATQILKSNEDEPILASWQYGLGRTASFTSDINGEWSKDLLTWNKGGQLVKNIIYWTIPSYEGSGKIYISQKSGSEALVEYYNDKVDSESKVKGVYKSENGEEGEIELTEVEPGKFTTTVPLKDLGFYTFNIREEKNGEIKNNTTGAFSMQYSDEYKFNKNSGNLDVLVEETSGKFINKPSEVFQGEIETAYRMFNLTVPFLIIAMILFLLDVAYRRLNLDLSKYLSKIRLPKGIKEKIENLQNREKVVMKNEEPIKDTTTKTENKESKKEKIKKEKPKKEEKKVERLNTSALLKKKSDRN